MRIGLVLPDCPQYSETFFLNKINGLTEAGHEVLVFAPCRKSNKTSYQLIRLPHSASTALQHIGNVLSCLWVITSYPGRIYKYFKLEMRDGSSFTDTIKSLYFTHPMLKHSLDWLHFGFATTALGYKNVARVIGSKMAVSIRGFDISIYPLKHKGCYTELWPLVDKLHSISDDLSSAAIKQGYPKDKPIIKITPAISTEKFRVKDNVGEIDTPLRILSVGRLHWKKGFGVAIDACRLLKEKGVNFVYTIIGEGPEYERLQYSILESGLSEHVFIKGKLPHEQISEEMERAHICLQPSIQEGFCNAVLEAQAKGLLCIVSDAEGLPENVGYGEYGWIFPKFDYKFLAGTILQLYQMPQQERKEKANSASKRINEEFSLEQQVHKFVEFYTQL